VRVNAPLSFGIGGVRTEVVFSTRVAFGEPSVTVFDSHTHGLFGKGAANPVVLSAGESSKNWMSVQAVLEECAACGMGRDGEIAGVGGGVVCDITAFAASLYMRGCGLTLVPTTLLAMVDAALGGKTGIDFLGYKNLVGTYYPAARIIIAAAAVRSLPDREYLSGLAEVVKTALIGDAELFALLSAERAAVMAREPTIVEEMIRRCLVVKGRIVEEDPKESGIRAVLNLGHTFGHALETATGFTGWTHGEAIAWGMGRALAAGVRMGITDPEFARRVESLLRAYGFRLHAPVRLDALLPGLQHDKKRRGGALRLVIPCGVGDVRIHEAVEEDLAGVLKDGQAEEKGAAYP
jgi:3-dehydroquinate synthase